MSGYLLHPENDCNGKAAALDVAYGSGHVVLLGFRPQWRGQSHGAYKWMFNALYYFRIGGAGGGSGSGGSESRKQSSGRR